jgi:hypothetical protein
MRFRPMVEMTADIIWDLDKVPAGCSEKVCRFLAYWRAQHEGDMLPGRQHIDPIDFPDLLPNIRLIDVVGDPPRFKVRLTGERVSDHFGQSLTGQYFDDVFPQFENRESCQAFFATMENRRPCWNLGVCDLNPEKDFVPFERLVLPLASDGKTVDMLLVLSLFSEREVDPVFYAKVVAR